MIPYLKLAMYLQLHFILLPVVCVDILADSGAKKLITIPILTIVTSLSFLIIII